MSNPYQGDPHGAPNLGDFSVDPKDFHEAAKVYRRLARYLKLKARAMDKRLAGCVNDATELEECCEHIYRELPRWARW